MLAAFIEHWGWAWFCIGLLGAGFGIFIYID